MDCEKELSEMPTQKRRIQCKLQEWLSRFLPAEIIGTILALLASYVTYYFTGNKILAAYAGTLGDSIGFYTPIIIYDSSILKQKLKCNNKKFNLEAFGKLLKRMLLEFGPAELLDSFIARPFLMYIFPIILDNYPIGVLIGKITGDIVFYIPVFISQKIQRI